MNYPEDLQTFQALVQPLRGELDTRSNNLALAAHDPRIRQLGQQVVQDRVSNYTEDEAAEIMSDYGLTPLDVDQAIGMSINTSSIDPTTRLAIARAAMDPKVIEVVRWLLMCDDGERMVAEDCCDELEKYLDTAYGLSSDMSDEVYNQCENLIREWDMQHGEA